MYLYKKEFTKIGSYWQRHTFKNLHMVFISISGVTTVFQTKTQGFYTFSGLSGSL